MLGPILWQLMATKKFAPTTSPVLRHAAARAQRIAAAPCHRSRARELCLRGVLRAGAGGGCRHRVVRTASRVPIADRTADLPICGARTSRPSARPAIRRRKLERIAALCRRVGGSDAPEGLPYPQTGDSRGLGGMFRPDDQRRQGTRTGRRDGARRTDEGPCMRTLVFALALASLAGRSRRKRPSGGRSGAQGRAGVGRAQRRAVPIAPALRQRHAEFDFENRPNNPSHRYARPRDAHRFRARPAAGWRSSGRSMSTSAGRAAGGVQTLEQSRHPATDRPLSRPAGARAERRRCRAGDGCGKIASLIGMEGATRSPAASRAARDVRARARYMT